jgi:purine-binding chemotaxis protein CheW
VPTTGRTEPPGHIVLEFQREICMKSKVRVLVFELDQRHYGLHLSRVDRVVRAVQVTPLPQSPEVVWGVIDVHGQVVPVFSLRKRFGFRERPIQATDQFILARTLRRDVALVADVASGVFELPAGDVIDSAQILPDLKQIEGVIQLADGMVLIHNLDRFLSVDEERALEHAMPAR